MKRKSIVASIVNVVKAANIREFLSSVGSICAYAEEQQGEGANVNDDDSGDGAEGSRANVTINYEDLISKAESSNDVDFSVR